MAKRISINLAEMAESSLQKLELKHNSWIYRCNTIIQAAIIAFSEMSEQQQTDYLEKVHQKDMRYSKKFSCR